jgi:CubicO group peptidase (beta-lactamase class C family)
MKRNSSFCLVGVITLAFLFPGSISTQDLGPKFDEYLNSATRARGFAGSVLIARDGKVIFTRGYGMANLEWDIPNTPQTKFRLGSLTKQFTAAAILLLQEQGKLNVQDPVCKHMSDCPKAWEEITIHHLLTHSSGIPNLTAFPDFQQSKTLPSPLESTIARFKDKSLEFKPGEQFKYSNSGYVLLGGLIERASGKSYEAYLQENIFQPLKMNSTGSDSNTRIIKQRAAGYGHGSEGQVNADYIHMSIPVGGGNLYSTVEDLYLWDQALYTEKLLSKKSLDATFTPFKQEYGYGWGIGQQFKRKHVSHGGGIEGFTTFISRYPDEKATVIVLSNHQWVNTRMIASDLGAIAFGEKYEIPRERLAIKVDPKLFDAYVGQYEISPNFILVISREGDRLMGAPTTQPPLELFPESETKYFFKFRDAQITFVKDESGNVTHLILHQGGNRQGKKIK